MEIRVYGEKHENPGLWQKKHENPGMRPGKIKIRVLGQERSKSGYKATDGVTVGHGLCYSGPRTVLQWAYPNPLSVCTLTPQSLSTRLSLFC